MQSSKTCSASHSFSFSPSRNQRLVSRTSGRHRKQSIVSYIQRCNRRQDIPDIPFIEHSIAGRLLSLLLSGSVLLTSSPASANNVTRRPQYLDAPPTSRSSGKESQTSPSVSEQVAVVDALTQKARAAAEESRYDEALQHYTEITTRFPSLAITERARIKRALLRYEAGQVQQAIAELEDEEVALRGYAEVHAALAAILYTDRPEQRQRAEDQWELANEFDHRYGDLQWVRTEKSWGPRLLGALQHFLALE